MAVGLQKDEEYKRSFQLGRYIGPVCRRCRGVGEKLFLKGERCYTPKCAVDRRRVAPGDKSTKRFRRISDYGMQLREKQKARFTYGLMESQFVKYVKAAFTSDSSTGEYLILQLETRLDNVICRLGFADSHSQARQLVNHGHFLLNGRKTNIPSYQVKSGDIVRWKESRVNSEYVQALVRDLPKKPVPEWLQLDTKTLQGTVIRHPADDELQSPFDTRLIVEFYSKR